jgi:ferredoxin-NADP reductase
MNAPPRRVLLKEVAAPAVDARILVFEPADAEPFEFEPGQYVCLSTTLDGKKVNRYYSIASGPHPAGRFELCVKPVGDGSPFGEYLARIAPGEEFECSPPGGTFQLTEPLRDTVFVAGGTGITPFRAMLHHVLAGPEDRSQGRGITLLFGARRPDELYFRNEFEQLESERPHFRFWPTISGPNGDWTGRRGRVQRHLDEALGNRRDATDVYICGPKAMVDDVRTRLVESGFDERAIHYEKYG